MNRIFNYTVLSIVCLFLAQSLLANDGSMVFSVNDRFSDKELQSQIESLSSHIDVRFNQEVKTIINTYISAGRNGSELILSRSHFYFPIMEHIIEEKQLPQELKYLSVIESGLRPSVKSSAGAVGLWQFMSGTARMYNLKISNVQDDRKNAARSTEAALEYLQYLYNRFDDWTLAMAAYNCGPGNVNKAIRRAGGKKDYWEIRQYLPKETRRYLPKLIATMYVMQYYNEYGLNHEAYEFSQYPSFGMAHVTEKLSFNEISQLSGLDIQDLRKYNPSYTQGYIPASEQGNILIMPEMFLLTYLQNVESMDRLQRVFYLKNKVFYGASAQKENMVMAQENVRTDFLTNQEIPLLKMKSAQLNPAEPKVASVQKRRAVAIFRLRKRQNLLDFIEEEGWDEQNYHFEVNSTGLVSIYQK